MLYPKQGINWTRLQQNEPRFADDIMDMSIFFKFLYVDHHFTFCRICSINLKSILGQSIAWYWTMMIKFTNTMWLIRPALNAYIKSQPICPYACLAVCRTNWHSWLSIYPMIRINLLYLAVFANVVSWVAYGQQRFLDLVCQITVVLPNKYDD